MKNIIFLDVDGVLNDENYIVKCYERHHQPMSMNFVPFNPRSLNNLRILYDMILEDGNKPLVVLSSTWRLHETDILVLNARLAEYGIYIKEITPYIHSNRGVEIISYLEEHQLTDTPFCILDDDNFDIINQKSLIPHFININRKRGLVKQNINKAINILRNEGGLI